MQLSLNASQDGNKNTKDATTSVMKQDEIFQEEMFYPRYSHNDSLDEAPAQRSWSNAITIYRDFVLSAFTDSYSTVRHGLHIVTSSTGKPGSLNWSDSEFNITFLTFYFVSLIGILL
jgi:hypothetical protein